MCQVTVKVVPTPTAEDNEPIVITEPPDSTEKVSVPTS